MVLKTLAFVVESLVVCGLYVTSYLIRPIPFFSMYGCLLLLFFLIQAMSSYLNHRKNKTLIGSLSPSRKKSIRLLVVGHREKKEYWIRCLESIRTIPKTNVHGIYIIIDGNEPDDYYMYHLAREYLHGVPHVQTYMVEKRGKRGLLSMGFKYIRNDLVLEYGSKILRETWPLVVVVDSDTELEPESLLRLEEVMADPNNGCATGVLRIYNTQDGLLPKMIATRYQYAFTIERACLSYFGCMTCCSGPLSIYRVCALHDEILERFATQTVYGELCEPGDDRHLTNLIMAQGYRSRQTSLAVAATEAPAEMRRFLLQQLRWSRSFFREVYWQLKCLEHHSWFLGIATVYELFFPFMILCWLCVLLYLPHDYLLYTEAIAVAFGIIVLRTLFMFVQSRDPLLWYNLLYLPMYFIFLLPIKIYAAGTARDSSWVTPDRSGLTRVMPPYLFFFLFIGAWQLVLLFGILVTGLHWAHVW